MSDKEACSRIEQRCVIKFLVVEGCKAAEIHRMSAVYGAACFIKKQTQGTNIKNKRKKDIRNKHRGHQSKRVIFHHDNARPHTAAQTVQNHQQPGLGTAPSSSLQPRPCPFRLSSVWSLERVHERHKVCNDDKVKSVVSNWLRHQSKDFYAEGIRKLVRRWEKCVKLMGDYV